MGGLCNTKVQNDVCAMIDVASLLLKTLLVYINTLYPWKDFANSCTCRWEYGQTAM